MCVTGASLWNTALLGLLRCGRPGRTGPCTLGVRAVDKQSAAVDYSGAKILP